MPAPDHTRLSSGSSASYFDLSGIQTKLADIQKDLAVHVERDDLIQAQLQDNQTEVRASLVQIQRIVVLIGLLLAGLTKSDALFAALAHLGGK